MQPTPLFEGTATDPVAEKRQSAQADDPVNAGQRKGSVGSLLDNQNIGKSLVLSTHYRDRSVDTDGHHSVKALP